MDGSAHQSLRDKKKILMVMTFRALIVGRVFVSTTITHTDFQCL